MRVIRRHARVVIRYQNRRGASAGALDSIVLVAYMEAWVVPAGPGNAVSKTPGRLILLWAFDRGEDGQLVPAWDAREMPHQRRAIQSAQALAPRHAGGIVWAREANIAKGDHVPARSSSRQAASRVWD